MEADHSFIPLGTGFFVGIQHNEYLFPFIVTARHVVEGKTGKIGVRLNTKAGGAEFISVPISQWKAHSDSAVDLAFCQLAPDFSIYDYSILPIDQLAEAREAYPVEPGKEVFIAGLYTSHHGLAKNIPVIRTGNIAAVPSEPVRTTMGFSEGILIELRSIAGLSGSPVFMQRPAIVEEGDAFHFYGDGFFYPIGVLVGYHVVQSREDDIHVPQSQGDEPNSEPKALEDRNTGFGVVVPFD